MSWFCKFVVEWHVDHVPELSQGLKRKAEVLGAANSSKNRDYFMAPSPFP